MYKVGDKVRIVGGTYGITVIGTEGTIEEVGDRQVIFRMTKHPNRDDWNINKTYPIHREHIELIRKKVLNNEIDYLNAFQFNFKEGI